MNTHIATPLPKPVGVAWFYTVALMSMLVSIDTSWRFFGAVLHISDTTERAVMFAVLEVALVACGYGMRANVHRFGRPGAPRWVAWMLCGLAGYMAWQLSGVAAGLARVALGPVLGLVMLHLALGIEIRARQHTATTWSRIGRELRERLLSRFGLANDARDALARTRDRAGRRAARLALAGWVPFRVVRVARALRISNVAHDSDALARMLAELAVIRHAAELATLRQSSPWQGMADSPGADVSGGQPLNAGPDRSLNGAERSVNGDLTRSVNATSTDARGHSAPTSERPRRRARTGRRATGATPIRRPLSYYLALARNQVTPGEVVTPAWVRTVIPDCPHSTSKNVADALNAETTTPETVNSPIPVAAGAAGGEG